ncbi:related to Transcription elongation factor 1 homolog [Saccharomycodes ludwigii]|uniref:Transcription elongation factor 1 homolog n=1 Tax=Saccharomycodes ludwigii TaxID=36035 RepID=A0A376B874_9ASCO|nr:hypothetical protein SCDLUD_004442 [Saccharomycodes ludwigii]KAH3899021.1 hypothetical protein SCDLUD_004442 [Saccharomycodes ludwigii]SSD60903.1 related to Transcription elongation factor 1 homolog [Saccharomycodes ludwigii]
MGKRKKSTRKPVKRLVQKLDTQFNCLFCNHDKSVTCTLDKKNGIGSLSCKICGTNFQTMINTLSQPVDVYSDWFDAVEEVNANENNEEEDDEDGSSTRRRVVAGGSSDSDSDYESDSDEAGSAAAITKKSISARPTYSDDSDEDDRIERTKRTAATFSDDD